MDQHSEPRAYIYTLADPDTGEIRYVGKTINAKTRVRSHVNHKDKTYKSRWLQTLLKDPLLEIIDDVPNDEWKFWEQHWIQVISGWGFRLTNGDKGGLGRDRLTEETRRQIAATLTGRPIPHRQKAIYAYDLKTGKQIHRFESVTSTKSIGQHPNIIRAARNSISAYGFAWSYDDLPLHQLPNRSSGKYRHPPEIRAKIAAAGLGRKMPPVSDLTRQRMRMSALNRRTKEEVTSGPD